MRSRTEVGSRLRALALVAAALVLGILPAACGGGGGGGVVNPPPTTASITVLNAPQADGDATPDGDCFDPGALNMASIVSLTYTPTGGAPVTVPFSPGITGGGFLKVTGIPVGTYTLKVTYDTGGANETDQCPPDTVTLAAGDDLHVQFQP